MIINGVEWRLRFVSPFNSNLHTPTGSQALGCCDKDNRIIYISNILNPIQLRIVLYHEITHAVIDSYKIKMTEQEEEKVAQVISYHGNEIINLTKGITRKE